jgi:hypothetical protein
MLEITIPSYEFYDELNNEFFNFEGATLTLEHSLLSISKWESKWCKPFLSDKEKTLEESIDYIRCMTLDDNVDPNVYKFITNDLISKINLYIDSKMTATTISNNKKTYNKEIVTSEIIYYWMVALNIPFECQTWHLNRLITLITVCSIKNATPKKMSNREIISQNKALNKARRKALNTKG